MRGVYYHTIDTKGRLNFPSKFRDELGGSFIISRGIPDASRNDGECLWVMSEEEWERRQQIISQQPVAVAQQLQYFFSESFDIEPDGQGRILVPPVLRTFAELKKDIAIIGHTNRVEIWDAQLWSRSNSMSGRDALRLLDGISF